MKSLERMNTYCVPFHISYSLILQCIRVCLSFPKGIPSYQQFDNLLYIVNPFQSFSPVWCQFEAIFWRVKLYNRLSTLRTFIFLYKSHFRERLFNFYEDLKQHWSDRKWRRDGWYISDGEIKESNVKTYLSS